MTVADLTTAVGGLTAAVNTMLTAKGHNVTASNPVTAASTDTEA